MYNFKQVMSKIKQFQKNDINPHHSFHESGSCSYRITVKIN